MAGTDIKTKHFLALDGLRGLVAIFVMLYHYTIFNGLEHALPRGYLGVDFFFVLSGFVIAHAYEAKLQKGGFFVTYCLQRVIRLWPLILLSVTSAYILSPDKKELYEYVLNLLMIPDFYTPDESAFAVNHPTWSLFYEIVINIFYAFFILYFVRMKAYLLILVSGIGLCISAFTVHATSVGTVQATFAAGFFRVAYSYYAGVLLWRFKDKIKFIGSINIIYVALLLLVMLSVPKFSNFNLIYDLVFVLLACPIIVIMGAKSKIQSRFTHNLCKIGGDISYPLYLLHMSVQFVFHPYVLELSTLGRVLFCIPQLCVDILVSMIIFKFYDVPVRSYLNKFFGKPQGTQKIASPVKSDEISLGAENARSLRDV